MAIQPFRNAGLKALSFALAVFLWWGVSRDQSVERSLRVPLEFQSIPAGMDILGDPPATVDVRVRGPSSVLSRVQPGEVVAVLNLAGARPGQRLFHVLVDEVRVPFGVQVAQVNPPTIALELEPSGTRFVPVKPVLEGDPAAGFVVGHVTVEPSAVEVVGPQSRLERVVSATTEPLSIQNATGIVRDKVTIGVADAAVRLREPGNATVTVNVEPAPIERAVSDVSVSFKNLKPGLAVRLTPSRIAVILRGRRDAVGAAKPDQVDLFVNLESLATGRYSLPVKAEPSDLFEVVRTEPAVVEARIR